MGEIIRFDKLTDLTHVYLGKIISSMHVHLNEHNCLEVLVLRGRRPLK